MGNSLGGKKSAKIMKISGETIKMKTPIRAREVLKDYPGHVLLESEAVKHYGIRAKPLEPQQDLKPKRLYFLVELPKIPEDKGPRRVRSGIQMSAKDRLESLMLARRSASDLTIMRPTSIGLETETSTSSAQPVRLKLRLPKSEVDKLMAQSNDRAEVAEKIVNLCVAANTANSNGGYTAESDKDALFRPHVHWKADHGTVKSGVKAREKRVGFLPISEAEIQLAVAS